MKKRQRSEQKPPAGGEKAKNPGAATVSRVVPAARELARPAANAFAWLAGLRFIGGLYPADRLWGINATAWLPSISLGVLLGLIGIAAATPAFIRLSRRMLRPLDAINTRLLAVVTAAVAGLAFWLLRMQTYFLGDGAVYLSEHYRMLHGLPVSESVLYSTGSAPLTGWLLAGLARLLFEEGSGIAGNPQFAFWVGGALAGVVFVALAVLAAPRLLAGDTGSTGSEGRGKESAAAAMLLLFTPGLLFFFGYVEYYTFAYVGIALTAVLSVEAARGRVGAVAPLLSLAVTAALHLMSLVLLPGVLLALLARRAGPAGAGSPSPLLAALLSLRGVLLLAGAALAAGGMYYFASGIAWEGSRVILSLVPFGEEGAMQHYTLLSGAHLGDVINMLLLTSAPALLVLPFLRARGWDAPSLVGLTHLIFAFFLMFFGYSGFGMARDWDVTAFFGVLAAVFILTRLRREETVRRAHLLHLAAWASVVAVLPWLLVNLDADRSVQRFRDIMTLDDRRIPGDFALNGYEHLRKYYQSTGDREGVAWAIGKKIEMVGYPADFRKYALAVIEGVPAAERGERWSWMMKLLRRHLLRMQEKGSDRSYAGSREEFRETAVELLTQLGQLPQSGGEMDALFDREAAALRGILGDDPLIGMAEAQRQWDRSGVFPGGTAFRDGAAGVRVSGTLAFYAGRGLLTAGDFTSAAASLEQSLALDSSFTLPAYYLAEAERQMQPPRLDRAITHYGLFLATPDRHRISLPEAQRRLMEDARNTLAELELLRLTQP